MIKLSQEAAPLGPEPQSRRTGQGWAPQPYAIPGIRFRPRTRSSKCGNGNKIMLEPADGDGWTQSALGEFVKCVGTGSCLGKATQREQECFRCDSKIQLMRLRFSGGTLLVKILQLLHGPELDQNTAQSCGARLVSLQQRIPMASVMQSRCCHVSPGPLTQRLPGVLASFQATVQ